MKKGLGCGHNRKKEQYGCVNSVLVKYYGITTENNCFLLLFSFKLQLCVIFCTVCVLFEFRLIDAAFNYNTLLQI